MLSSRVTAATLHSSFAGGSSGNSPGYGITLVAETTSGSLISAECCAAAGGQEEAGTSEAGMQQGTHSVGMLLCTEHVMVAVLLLCSTPCPSCCHYCTGSGEPLMVPEDIGSVAAKMLLEEIHR